MALNKIERRLLEEVRESLIARKYFYICYAIAGVKRIPGVKQDDLESAKNRLIGYILEKLSPHVSLTGWLHDMAGGYCELSFDFQREARLAWVAWMLGENPVISETSKAEIRKANFLQENLTRVFRSE